MAGLYLGRDAASLPPDRADRRLRSHRIHRPARRRRARQGRGGLHRLRPQRQEARHAEGGVRAGGTGQGRQAGRPRLPPRAARRLRGRDRLRRAVRALRRAGAGGGGGDRDPLPRHHRRAALHEDGLRAVRAGRRPRRRGRGPGDGLRLRARRHDRLAHGRRHGRAGRAVDALLLVELHAEPGDRADDAGDDQRWRPRVAEHGVDRDERRRLARDVRVPGPCREAADDALPLGRADHGAAPRPHPERPRDHERRRLLQRAPGAASSPPPCGPAGWR